MLHLRIVSPPDLTASVLQALADDAGERSPAFAWASGPRNHPVGVMLCNASGRFIPERTDVLAHRGGRTAM
jgi:hypothetical protein